MSAPLPRIRPEIDALPTQHEGEAIFVLYDTSGLSQAQIGVSPPLMFVTMLLDGTNSALDIQDRFRRESGDHLPGEQIQCLLKALDNAFFLEGEHYAGFYRRVREEFENNPVRPSNSAGSAYSADPAELAAALEAMLEDAPPDEEVGDANGRPRGAIIPHLDYARGAAGYGQAYRTLAQYPRPEIVLVLGTAHAPMTRRYAVCNKDFDLPGGAVRCAREAADTLLRHCAGTADFAADVFVHRGEHSVELQAVWLRHIWGEDIVIIPVLAEGMTELIQEGEVVAEPEAEAQFAVFAEAVNELATRHDIFVLASADLAHVGPRFNDPEAISEALLAQTEETDRHYLAAVAAGDPAAGLASLARHGNRYRVCGFGSIYALGRILPGVRGRLLGYHQAASPEMQQAVTFASMLFG